MPMFMPISIFWLDRKIGVLHRHPEMTPVFKMSLLGTSCTGVPALRLSSILLGQFQRRSVSKYIYFEISVLKEISFDSNFQYFGIIQILEFPGYCIARNF